MATHTHHSTGKGMEVAGPAAAKGAASPASLMIAVSLVSASLFVYQVTLTRVFSPMLRYHFVFLVVSFAVFGLGIGGLSAHAYTRKKGGRVRLADLAAWPTVLGASVVLAFSLIYKLPFLRLYVLYAALSTLPFIAGGFLVSLAFLAYPLSGHRLYFADLLGAAAGGLSAVAVLNRFGLTHTVLLAVGLCLVASLVLTVGLLGTKQAITHAAMLVLVGAAALYHPMVSEFEARFTGYYSSPLTSLARLRQANQAHSLEAWSWDAYSRTDVINHDSDPDRKIISIDGGSNSEMIRFDERTADPQALRSDLGFLPFGFGEREKTLLIGPGGGKDILFALLGGSSEIHAVEINAGSVRLARKYGTFNGNIYDREEVRLHIQDGRNFVKQTTERYDVIYLAQVMTEVAETVGYALAENYIYTTEALREYWNALNDDGKLAFVLHGERDLLRLINTLSAALTELEGPQTRLGDHLVIINRIDHSEPGAIHMPLVMLKKSPLSLEEVQEVRKLAAVGGNQPLYLPGSADGRDRSVAEGGGQEQSGDTKLRLGPTRDDRPYFFDFRGGVEASLLWLLGAVTLVILLFFRPAFKANGLGWAPWYFMGLGLGFMLIEIPLLQKFTLLLGHPTRSLVVAVPALLAGAGLGSLASNWGAFSRFGKYLPLVIVPVVLALVYVLLGRLVTGWVVSSLALRMLLAVALLLPMGFFLGMPFPMGIRMITLGDKRHVIPLMWGLNGTTSIGGSVLAVVVAMEMGLSYSLASGGLVYLLLFLLVPFGRKGWRLK